MKNNLATPGYTCSAQRPSRVGLHRYAIMVMGATFLLIAAGGNVTSKDAGLAVPDWPLSFNSINPSGWTSNMDGTRPGVRDEHFHRLVGASVGLLVIGLVLWLQLREPRAWVRRLGYIALVAVCIQGLMGGLRVTEQSLALAIVHSCFGQAFFCLLIAIALVTSPKWPGEMLEPDDPTARPLRFWTVLLVAMVFVQLILGALLRHLGSGSIAIWHICGALAVGACLMQTSSVIFTRGTAEKNLGGWTILLFILFGLQIMLGVLSYVVVMPTPAASAMTFMRTYVPTVHVAVGASILGMSFALATRAYGMTSFIPLAMPRTAGEACA
ncbi:MAG: cytochrome aa3 oxidase assembly protein CtaA [Phycisphaerae bacterium]